MKDVFVHIIFILFFITLVLAFGWYQSCTRNSESSDINPPLPDTCFVEKIIYDTIFQDTIIYKEKKVTDTIYVNSDNGGLISLPVIQKHYQDMGLYDIWISGVEPLNLDSTRVYQKKEVSLQTIYKDKIVYKDKESRKFELYLGGGFYSFSDTFIPKAGISTKIGEKWFISANLGFDKDIYDISINYKIF